MSATLRFHRDAALSQLAAVITAEWGDRCARSEAGCSCCMAWLIFDAMEKLTDGTTLDDPSAYEGVAERFHLGAVANEG